MKKRLLAVGIAILIFVLLGVQQGGLSGCAQIGSPTGGPKDTLPPTLLKAQPSVKSVNVTGNKITFNFDEYVEVKEIQTNLIVSPQPKKAPEVTYKLKTITVKLKDTLMPNTTYAFNFGNAIADVNEGNVLRDFNYVFSTGPAIDSLTLSGTVTLAETGKSDSSLVVLLYRQAHDSAVTKRKPDYIARINGKGRFQFTNLPADEFKVYALKDGDGGKTYNSPTELFAFADQPLRLSGAMPDVTLLAYAEKKEEKDANKTTGKTTPDKKLRYSTNLSGDSQDLLSDLIMTFNNPLKTFDSTAIRLTDTNQVAIPGASIRLDTTARNVIVKATWREGEPYQLLLDKTGITDSAGNQIAKADTLRFTAKRESDYGTLVLRFKDLDTSLHPVLQFIQTEAVVGSYPITGKEWRQKLFRAGEYEVRILYDRNRNGIWDPGSYTNRRQPEKVIPLPQKIAIRANWDNERDISF
jgi:hypothetical protein